MGTYIAQPDIQAAMSDEDYTRLYDRKGSGSATEILNFTNQCISVAESLTNMSLAGRFPVPLPPTVDTGVKQCVIWIANGEAAGMHPSLKAKDSPYQVKRTEALEILRRMARDWDFRPVTSPAGLAQPVAATVNATNSSGMPNDPYTRAANGEDSSDF